jgi:hypothetical protein
VVLGGDPSKDVRAFAAVQFTLRAGKVIYQSNERSVRKAGIHRFSAFSS